MAAEVLVTSRAESKIVSLGAKNGIETFIITRSEKAPDNGPFAPDVCDRNESPYRAMRAMATWRGSPFSCHTGCSWQSVDSAYIQDFHRRGEFN
jgi:hypothetical protein